MTDKEFKRLSRSQLIDIIYQLQLKQDELMADNEALSKELMDKRIRLGNAGNIAEAALEIHNVMQAAQDAADHYLEEVQLRIDGEYERIMSERKKMLRETQKVAAILISHARKQAAEIIAQARQEAEDVYARAGLNPSEFDAKVEEMRIDCADVEDILKEYRVEQ